MKYKSIFISDVHLGTKGCKANQLLNFLDEIECENLFLVGDIIDGWKLRIRNHWPEEHSKVVRKIIKISNTATVRYIIGNHDDFIRPFIKNAFSFGNIHLHNEYVYKSLNKKYLITHGDLYDRARIIPRQVINAAAQVLPESVDGIRGFLTTEKVIKRKFVNKYDGVICGHTHDPKVESFFMNCGDWKKKCTYITEDYSGHMKLNYYKK